MAQLPGLHFATALLPRGWAADVRLGFTDDGRIATVEEGVAPRAGDERHAIGLPGLASLHSHAFQRAMAGLAERRGPGQDSFWSWRESMYGFALKMSPDDVEAVAAQLYAEMLEGGFTRVGEFHYLHHDPDGRPYADRAEMAVRIAAAAGETGIGLTLLPAFYAHSGFGGAAPGPGQRRFVETLDGFARLLEGSEAAVASLSGGRLGLAPHSLRAVTPDELRDLVALAGERPIHVHAAEQVAEVEACLAWSGLRPVAWLLAEGGAGPGWCLIHATHMTPDETEGLARSGAVAGLCPITEANLGDGTFAGRAFLAAGGAFGVGSDSNVQIGAAEELRQLEYSQRILHQARNVMTTAEGSTGRALFDAALAGGHAALAGGYAALAGRHAALAGGREASASRVAPGLAPGAPADLVSLRADHPALAAHAGDAILDGWIFSGGRDLVDSVWVGGRRRVSGGRHHDRDRVAARFAATMRRLVA